MATPERRPRRDGLSQLTETLPAALVRLDRDLRFVSLNSAAERLYGATREELVGTTVHDAGDGWRGAELAPVFEGVLRSGEPRSVQTTIASVDATYEVRVWPDGDGLTLFVHDVSERVHAQRALARASGRLEVLAEAGERLSRSLQPAQVLDVLVDVIVPALAESITVVVTGEVAELLDVAVDADVERLYPVRVRHVDPAAEADLDAVLDGMDLRTSLPTGAGPVVRTGRPQYYARVPDELLRGRARDATELALMRRLNTGPRLTLPLASPGGALGALTVSGQDEEPLDDVLLAELARRAAVALQNASSYAAQHRAVTVLQRALLPRRTARVPGVEVATRYLPASAGALAGGDFFTTVDVDGVLVCALGDVMGHGTPSAARAGQLHGLVAVLALQGLGPGRLLAQLGSGIEQIMDLDLATLLVCSYDPRTRRLTAASAGHPPPLLVPAAGPPAYLDVEPGPPLGAPPGEHPTTSVDLSPGEAVLLFSDGLVERRTEPIDEGLHRLRCAAAGTTAPEELCERVLRAVHAGPGTSDDIALLALRHP